MSLKQQAYRLIDLLSDDDVQVIIRVMERMLPKEEHTASEVMHSCDGVSTKKKAYLRMQELRKESSQYDISETQRELALNDKYGMIGQ